MRPLHATALAAALLAPTLLAAPAVAQKSGGVLKAYHRDNPPSASIHEEATISTDQPFMAVFNNLVVFDQHAKTNSLEQLQPELGTSWAWSEDGTKLTFKLREGVQWHDGKPFTSEDVKCTWDTVAGKRNAGWRKNPREPWYFNLEEVTTNGEYEVTFNLKRPQPSFLAFLSGGFSPVYPCHVDGREMRAKPIGTGPFKVAEFKQNEFIRLVKNENYWKEGRPYLDGIDWTIITARSTRVLAFINGNFDLTFAQDVSIPLLADVQSKAPDAYCELQASNVHGNLLVNREAPPFDNADIRRAMMLAIDRKAFVTVLSQGKDTIGGAMLPVPAGVWGAPAEYFDKVPGYGPDIEANRAEGRKIMESLGYGPDNPLRIKVATRNIAIYRDPAVILMDQLSRVHIAGELDTIETGNWYNRLARKDYQVGLNVTGVGIDDPDVNFYENYSCGSQRNYTNYCNREIQDLFDKQSAMTDFEARRKLVWEIDAKLQADGARPVIYHSHAATWWQPYVKGITRATNSIYNNWRMEDAWLDK